MIDVLTGRQVGDPVRLRLALHADAPAVFGRIVGFDGVAHHGEHPILLVTTPHGTTYFGGLFFVNTAREEELAHWEELARVAGAPLYRGKLIKTVESWIEAPRD